MSLKLIDDHMCYVCGKKNSKGLKLGFQHPEQGLLTSSVTFSKEHQGFKGIVHGGMIATVLDEMMVNLALVEGMPVVTAEFTVRLKKPCKTGQIIHLESRIDPKNRQGRVIRATALAKDAHGELLASATGTCMRIREKVDQTTKGS